MPIKRQASPSRLDHVQVINEADEGTDNERRERDPRLVAAQEVELEDRGVRNEARNECHADDSDKDTPPHDDAAHTGCTHLVRAMEVVELMRRRAVEPNFPRTLFPRFVCV